MVVNKHLSKLTVFVYRVVASRWFFAAVVVLFVLQAMWLVFTAIYPMPFDEYAHVGAIQLYAEQWSWVITEQPLDTGIVGDVTREPSFLYRWLMSYPYRVFRTFLSAEQTIIVLRLLNVAMVAGGIVLFRRLLREWGISVRITNVVLLAFVMTPIVPFLAAHVNYDNLMFLLAPVVLLYAGRLIKSNEKLVEHSALLVLAGGTTVLAKQTFLPIMVVIAAYVALVVGWRNRGRQVQVLKHSWRKVPKNVWFYFVVVGLLCLVVFTAERYGGNLLRYGTYRPACEVVQPVALCEDFGPWYRNNVINVQNRPAEPPYGNPLSFSQYWVSRMMRGYFAIFQHTPTEVVWEKEPYGPIVTRPLLPLPVSFAVVVAVGGVLAVLYQRRKVWAQPYLRLALVAVIGFLVIQWLFNYSGYLKMWKAEAIQARYTFPLMILIFTLIAWSISRSIECRRIKAGLVVLLFVFYVWGGGIAGWLLRADDTWRWQHPVTQVVNQRVQTVLRYMLVH